MKAIFVKYHRSTGTKPARYVAKDSDGNRARGNTPKEAVQALCQKMNWKGRLARGYGKAGQSVYIWLTSSANFYLEV